MRKLSRSRQRLADRRRRITARLPKHKGFRPLYPGQKPRDWKKKLKDRQARQEKHLGAL